MAAAESNSWFQRYRATEARGRAVVNTWGRQMFASSFAKGGIAASMFADTPGQAALNAFKISAREGSARQIRNLEHMVQKYPDSKRVAKALKAARGPQKMGKLGMAMCGAGAAFAAYSIAQPLLATRGSATDKVYNSGREAFSYMVGFPVGSTIGKATGTAIGAVLGSVVPFVGTAIGAGLGSLVGHVAGGFVGGELAGALYDIPQRMVDRERSRRNLNWRNDQSAFMTQSAFTMRQQSLQAMNRGMVTARSMLGREGIMLHQ